ncbi:hypothetical protein LRS73_10415 [Methylobacterium currus]|uniref:hypothetical protein n=1 Tax=Methylobacterium currus TaxID=2051553 RepID=UPI001E486229|nr:hypothetical protein [Methylobacterium currus]UHC18213.1 hypothetical protein LRS73_10415 [Methylobacterium currus]
MQGLSKVVRILRQDGLRNLASRGLGFAYRRGVRPLLPVSGPARLGGVLTCNGLTVADRYVPRAWLPWWMTDPSGNSSYEAALVGGLGAHVRPGDRVVVIGGGIGVTAVNAALLTGPSGPVTCFEGSLDNCRLVGRTAALNGVGNLTVRHAVVGSSIAVYGSITGRGEVLPAAELPPCDVLELDCEGAEIGIVREMTIRPRVLLVETHGVYGSPTQEVAAAMEACGYAVSDLGWAEPSQEETCRRNDIRVLSGLRRAAP